MAQSSHSDAPGGAPRQVSLARLADQAVTPDTRLGQHFLIDDNLVRLALRLAGASRGDVALEVGPGLGVLTRMLADATLLVHAVEIDRRLESALGRTLAGVTNVRIVWGDALRVDLGGLTPPPTIFVANLPYQIATPLLVDAVETVPTVSRFVVMVQREVAERLFAPTASVAYGAVSVLMRLAFERTATHRVARSVFVPQPNVDSSLVAYHRRDGWADLASEWSVIRRLVHAAFAHRRKTITNALHLGEIATRGAIDAALDASGITPRQRAEDIPPDRYVALTRALPAARGV